MSNDYFLFRQFTVYHDKCAMKVGTDGVLLGACANIKGIKSILDVGTGTGLITLMLAQRSNAPIDAVEIEKDAAQQAMQNVAASPWQERIKIHHIPFQEYSRQTASRYDLIISNPPYYHNDLKSPDVLRNKARHTIQLNYNDLIEGSDKLLTAEGRLCVILPHDMSDAFINHAWFYGLYPLRILKICPTASRPPSRVVLECSRYKNHRPDTTEIAIMKDDLTSYTEEYKKLTDEYYL